MPRAKKEAAVPSTLVDVGFDFLLVADAAKVPSGAARGYTYDGEVVRVVDGDTVVVLLTLAEGARYRHSCRLFGINAPEHNTPTGAASRDWLTQLLPAGTKLRVATHKDEAEKYGRLLGVLTLADGRVVNDLLVETGHALKWDGKGAKPV